MVSINIFIVVSVTYNLSLCRSLRILLKTQFLSALRISTSQRSTWLTVRILFLPSLLYLTIMLPTTRPDSTPCFYTSDLPFFISVPLGNTLYLLIITLSFLLTLLEMVLTFLEMTMVTVTLRPFCV